MSIFRRLDLLDPFLLTPFSSSPSCALLPPAYDLVLEHHHHHHLGYALDLLTPAAPPTSLDLHPFSRCPLDLLDDASSSDLLQIERSLAVRTLTDRVSALELGLDRAIGWPDYCCRYQQQKQQPRQLRDRKYKWTAEVSDGVERKYKVVAQRKAGGERDVKWTAEIKARGRDGAPVSRTYAFEAASAPAEGKGAKGALLLKEKKGKKAGGVTRLVEVTDPEQERGVLHLKKALARRAVCYRKGKNKVLSPLDAALMIQMSFRHHLVRRSQVLRALRELSAAKAKLKELRALFTNFSYRRRIAIDAEERQRFSEKIIVLLLTVDAIEGPDYIVRAARKSMLEELEAMLEIVDPQPPGRLNSLKRRKFDLPDCATIRKEMALGVAEVVQLLNEDDSTSA